MRRISRAALAPLLLFGCGQVEPAGSEPKAAPAEVVSWSADGSASLVLTQEAAQRLGIALAAVEGRRVQATRVFPGELVVPLGARAELRAPFAATVRSCGQPPYGGNHREKGELVFVLEPLLSPESERQVGLERAQLEIARAENEGALERARVRTESARVAFERAEALVSAQAGSPRARDEARAELDAAETELRTHGHLREVRDSLASAAQPGNAPRLELGAPFSGEIVERFAVPDQVVAAGTHLATLENLDTLWIRVPVDASSAARMPPPSSARLLHEDGRPAPDALAARAIAGPPSADAASGTVDLWFELANPAHERRPGQRVAVELPLAAEEPRLVVPWSALVFDAQGGAWVYVHAGEARYRRVRVELERVAGSEALLALGPEPGTEVVAVGAAELFGTEFGAGR